MGAVEAEINRKQKLVAGVGLGIIALMLLFPPWRARVRIPPACDATVRLGYAFILLPPSETGVRQSDEVQRRGCPVTASFELVEAGVSIDIRRWLVPIVVVAGIAATAFFALSDATTVPDAIAGVSGGRGGGRGGRAGRRRTSYPPSGRLSAPTGAESRRTASVVTGAPPVGSTPASPTPPFRICERCGSECAPALQACAKCGAPVRPR